MSNDRLNRRSLLLAVLALAGAAALPHPARAQSAVMIGKEGWLFPGWESLTQIDQPGIAATIALMKGAQERLAARKVGLIVLVVPSKPQFYPERLPDGQKLGPELATRYAGILAALKTAGITTIDDLAVLKAVSTGKRTAFYRADYHWTTWAAEASADAVGQLILKSYKLRGKAGTGDVLGDWISERHLGDLAANFLPEDQQKAIGVDTYTIRDNPPAKAGLLDADPAPVQVIGNSFVQPYYGFPQKLSSVIDRPVGLTWNPGSTGPWATMLQYLETPAFKAAPPQLIVWQFNEGQLQHGPAAAGQWDGKSILSPQAWQDRLARALAK